MESLTSNGFQVCATYIDNNKTKFVVNASFLDGEHTVSTSGVGDTPENAYSGAIASAVKIAQANRANDDKEVRNNANSSSNNKENLNGGGSKPISEGQKKFVYDLTKKQGIDTNNYTKSKFNKSVNDLTGAEANVIINELKNN